MLAAPPIAMVSEVEAIFGGWWRRSGGYPAGSLFGTVKGAGL